jgi:hypothetical protein
MREFEPKEIIVVSIIATPIALLLALFTTGAGHGIYAVVKILFPYTMISTATNEIITGPYVVLAILQFPIYGLLLALGSKSKGGFGVTAKLLGAIHICAAVLAFMTSGSSFTP